MYNLSELSKVLQSQILVNPEVWHARNLSHPGKHWYIKTILPKSFQESSKLIVNFWYNLSKNHPNFVKITSSAYNWHGKLLDNWNTIWLYQDIDIEWTIDENGRPSFLFINFYTGLKNAAQYLQTTLGVNDNHEYEPSFAHIHDILWFLTTYASNDSAKTKRKTLEVIENEQNDSEKTK